MFAEAEEIAKQKAKKKLIAKKINCKKNKLLAEAEEIAKQKALGIAIPKKVFLSVFLFIFVSYCNHYMMNHLMHTAEGGRYSNSQEGVSICVFIFC